MNCHKSHLCTSFIRNQHNNLRYFLSYKKTSVIDVAVKLFTGTSHEVLNVTCCTTQHSSTDALLTFSSRNTMNFLYAYYICFLQWSAITQLELIMANCRLFIHPMIVDAPVQQNCEIRWKYKHMIAICSVVLNLH